MEKILIIKLGALGDTVMASTMLTEIAKRYPRAAVTWMAGRGAAVILDSLDAPPDIFYVDDRALLQGGKASRLRELLRINRRFAGKRFDLVLMPYRSRIYHLLHLAIRYGEVRSFSGPRGLVPGRHHAAEYVRLVTGEDGPANPQPRFPALKADVLHVRDELKPVPDVLLMPGGAKNLLADTNVRRWPLESYVSLAATLLEQNYSVGIIGGPEDQWARKAFTFLPVKDYIGATKLPSLMGLLASTRLLVTHDTGPMHLMALVGGKIIALFGATDPKNFAPIKNAVIMTAPGFLPCRPCYDGKNFASCPSPLCMSGITPESVAENALTALKAVTPSNSMIKGR